MTLREDTLASNQLLIIDVHFKLEGVGARAQDEPLQGRSVINNASVEGNRFDGDGGPAGGWRP